MKTRAYCRILCGWLAVLQLCLLCAAAQTGAPARLKPGDPAPDFSLVDLEGQTYSLSELTRSGKIAVLEWYSPECPISTAYYTAAAGAGRGLLPATYEALQGDDLVWLAINSVSTEAEGNSLEDNQQLRETAKVSYPMLLDSDFAVAGAYGARKTPDIFIVDTKGKLAYCGAVDEGDFRDYPRGRNYIVETVTALREGRPPEVRNTEPFGCAL